MPISPESHYCLMGMYEFLEITADVYHDENNEGLAIVNLDVNHKACLEFLDVPEWVGEEITSDERFTDYNLLLNPYNTFNE